MIPKWNFQYCFNHIPFQTISFDVDFGYSFQKIILWILAKIKKMYKKIEIAWEIQLHMDSNQYFKDCMELFFLVMHERLV